ncbi:MAG: type II toxin-antitoxin system RelE/ParE family toxin [Bradyrhizobium sp.]|nr:MAG: type II toxin-antitoxin system RelE/ParE family toxin [Bradyrhizobium sp.]
MRVRYTPRARDDLAKILKFIDERSPQGSRNVKRTIRKTIELIGQFPLAGKDAEESGTRVLPAGRYPYLIYWFVDNDAAWIVHIRDVRRAPWAGA